MIVSPGRQRQHNQETDICLCLNKFLFKPTIPIYIYPNQTTGREAMWGGGGTWAREGGGRGDGD